MADLNKAELRRLAEAAMAGDWFKAGDLLCFDVKTGESHGLNVEDERFIASASPVAVLELITENERLQRNRDMWQGQVERQAAKLERLHQVVTGEFESKEAFIARVRAVLSGESA